MLKTRTPVAALAAAIAFGILVTIPGTVAANDAALDRGTILMISTDSITDMKAAVAKSDIGAFTKDKEIAQIWARIKTAVTELTDSQMGPPGSPEQAMGKALTSYLTAMCDDTTGRVSFSLGIRDGEAGPQLQMLLHCQGKPTIGAAQQQLVDAMSKMSSEQMTRTSFEVAGTRFEGFDLAAMPSPIRSPDGIYFGQKGDDYFIGVSRAGLAEYLSALGGGEAAAKRLGAESFYKASQGVIGDGHMKFFFNLRPAMQIAQMFMPPGDETMMFINALGLFDLDGYYASQSFKSHGIEARGLVGLAARSGIFELLPTTNQPQQFPGYISRHSMQAFVLKLEINRLLDIVYKMAGAVMGEEGRGEVDNGLAEFKKETGLDAKTLIAALDGTCFFSNAMGEPDPNAMLPIAAGEMLFGLKVADMATIQNALDVAAKSPELEGVIRNETHLGRKLMVFGNTAEDDLYAGATPEYAVTLDKNWLLFGVLREVKHSLATLDGPDTGRLNTDPRVMGPLAKVGTNGMMLSYTDTGATICSGLDVVRPLLGFLPFLIGDNPQLMKLADPSNLPSNNVIKKYFGVSVASARSATGGIELTSLSPKVYTGAAAKEKAPKATPKPTPKTEEL
ncbi:MAG: hypothetical protein AAF581_04290 [Planctomycetota bacterium]